ncbi:MAG TPA: NAD-dependent epimerase/dehydratase family protein [Pseudonocardia sp.]|jgi:UDP-glucose 4-epimerase|uniref:NAD-dependent epimerase/dehydratase family protein n=1 Tax=Pseudonocardia sp. TaxID=60912 RepID=UPI002B4B0014|nr:NAD-dependent epimerase/dehydratase family protein [Pseudonocardia sp.]HLU59666.1 NAD-dependent epimerase/dehydratase family protein [Pseudonocardia sp.]
MRVLVTGASGFVGYAVAAALTERGHTVVGLTRSTTSALPEGVRRAHGDLSPDCLRDALADVDGVCHLAARTRARDSRADPLGYWRTNVGGTLALLEAMTATGARRLVLASTCIVYGERDTRPIDETAVTAPTSPYGTSKLAADNAAMDLAATGAIGAISLRAFNIAGALPGHPDPDETRLIPRAMAVQRGTAPELVVNGDGGAIRDFVHVVDVADAFARALEACEPGTARVYNIGSGRPTRVRDVIDVVEQVTGRPVARRHVPPAGEPQVLLADSKAIRADLGWDPRRSDLRVIVEDAWTAVCDR